MKGWHKDNYRHSLAARGFTRYYGQKYMAKQETVSVFKDVDSLVKEPTAPQKTEIIKKKGIMQDIANLTLTPTTTLARERGAAVLAAYEEAIQRAERPIGQIIASIDRGSYISAAQILDPKSDGGKRYITDVDGSITGTKGQEIYVTKADQEAVKAALSERALTLVNAGMPVPEAIKKNLDPEFITHLKTIKEAKRREDETPFRKVLREKMQAATIGTVAGAAEAPGEGLAFGKAGWDSLGNEQQFAGVGTQFGRLSSSDSPLKKNSVLAGHEEDGMASPLRWMDNENVPRLDQSWAFLGNVENPVMSGTKRSELASKAVSDQVDSLYDSKDKLAETDLSKYEDGVKAFKKGDREALIKSIAELESEENKLKDRWTIIGETHRNILSSNNQQSVFHKSGSNFALENKSGADKIADQTEKLARVRADVLKSMNQTYTRRALLQGNLTRLNANMSPDKGAPREVKRLEDVRASSMKIGDIPNPVLRASNYVTEVPQ
jgi:ACT domain-containing protein